MLLSPHVDEMLLVHQVTKLLPAHVARVVLWHGTSRRVPAVMLLKDGVEISGDQEGTVVAGEKRRESVAVEIMTVGLLRRAVDADDADWSIIKL